MAIFPIRTFGDPVLRADAEPVETFDDALRRLTEDMIETMYAAPGVGLAAPQIGISKRICVFDAGDGPHVLINPEIISKDGLAVTEEGCLSVPGYYEEVERAEQIRVRYLDRNGQAVEQEAEGLLAVCIQHEIDHLDGKLFVDYLSEAKRQRIRKKLAKDRRQQPAEAAVL